MYFNICEISRNFFIRKSPDRGIAIIAVVSQQGQLYFFNSEKMSMLRNLDVIMIDIHHSLIDCYECDLLYVHKYIHNFIKRNQVCTLPRRGRMSIHIFYVSMATIQAATHSLAVDTAGSENIIRLLEYVLLVRGGKSANHAMFTFTGSIVSPREGLCSAFSASIWKCRRKKKVADCSGA